MCVSQQVAFNNTRDAALDVLDGAFSNTAHRDISDFIARLETFNATDIVQDQIGTIFDFESAHFVTITPSEFWEHPAVLYVRSKGEVQLKEPLLTIGAPTWFRPSHIYPRLDTYPAILQNFDLSFDRTNIYRTTNNMPTDIVAVLTPTLTDNSCQLDTYSRNVFRQEDKSFQSIDVRVPFIQTFSTEFSTAERKEQVVQFDTMLGPPDYVFIRCEYVVTGNELFYEFQPRITKLKIRSVDQDLQSISCLSDYQLRAATRRNSNPRADLEDLERRTGAILLSKADFCQFVDFKMYQANDVLQGSFSVQTVDIDHYPVGAKDTRNAKEREYDERVQVRMIVQFIYQDHRLTGQAGTMRFKHDAARMGKFSLL